MATKDTQKPATRERTPDDQPELAKKAIAEREAAIARGETVPTFDADGFEVA